MNGFTIPHSRYKAGLEQQSTYMSLQAKMKLSSFIALFLISASAITCTTAQQQVESAATEQIQGLYKVLHDVALPGSNFDLTIPKRQCLALL